jgi:signal transduction histidine kinase
MYHAKTAREPSIPVVSDSPSSPVRHADESAVDIVAVAAHEIKTPLTSIVGYASMLRANRGAMSRDAEDAAFVALERQAHRLARIVDQLLTFGRLAHPTGSPTALVDLEAVIEDALEIAPPEDPVSVIVMVASDATGPLVWAERTTLTRAVVNLLTNAYAHGGPHISIEVGMRARRVDLIVQDDGDGVPDAFVPTLFEPFARGARRGESRSGGAGLGLAIARGIAVSFGGSLTHEAVTPHGARLRLSLPASS